MMEAISKAIESAEKDNQFNQLPLNFYFNQKKWVIHFNIYYQLILPVQGILISVLVYPLMEKEMENWKPY